MPEPSIELMLREVKKAPETDGSAVPATGDDRGPDDLIAAARERQSQGTVLLMAEDRVVAFGGEPSQSLEAIEAELAPESSVLSSGAAEAGSEEASED